MRTEPLRLQDTLQQALASQLAPQSSAPQVLPVVRYPVAEARGDGGFALSEPRGSAARPLLAASAAVAATAVSVALNAPALLLASVAGIAIYTAVPVLRRSFDRVAPAKPVQP